MKQMRFAFLFVAALWFESVFTVAHASVFDSTRDVTADLSKRCDSLFAWGEYDTLIGMITTVMSRPADAIKPFDRARFCAYSGVALFSKGNIAGAREAFLTSIIADSTFEINPKLISDDIANFCMIIREEFRSQHQANHYADSVAQAEKLRLNQAIIQHKIQQNSTLFILVGVATVGSGFFAYYQHQQANEAFARFENARITGDRLLFDRSKKEVLFADRLTFTGVAASLIAGGISCLYLSEWIHLKRQKNTLQVSWYFSPFGEGAGVAINW